MAVGYVGSATSGSQASVASFNISASLGTGARCGLVFVTTFANSGNPIESGVTWNGTSMTQGYYARDTDTEPGVTRWYFLDNISNGAVTVTRTNNTVACVGFAISISAGAACELLRTEAVVSGNTVVVNGNASGTGTGGGTGYNTRALDGDSSVDTMRFACAYTGAASPLAADSGTSTSLQSLDATAYGTSCVRETTAGTGSRSVGFATSSDDYAALFVVVREVPSPGPFALARRLIYPQVLAQ